MLENEMHFMWGKDRYTECGIDTWEDYVKTSHIEEIVTCKECLYKLGFDIEYD